MSVRAFPSAEGYGVVENIGGRGGTVVAVTNTNPSGAGSLKAAMEATYPRHIVPKVAGTIALDSNILVKNPYMTYAGQTAPGDGLLIRNYQVVIQTHDVIIRHLRNRIGLSAVTINPTTNLGNRNTNGFLIYSGTGAKRRITLDHCDSTWANDQCGPDVNAWGSGITIQWCTIGEGTVTGHIDSLNHNAGNVFGAEPWMPGSTSADPNEILTITMHHCWYHSTLFRTPLCGILGKRSTGANGNPSMRLDLRNLLVFNNSNNAIHLQGRFYTQSEYNSWVSGTSAPRAVIEANVVGCLMIPGAGPDINNPGNNLIGANTLARIFASNNRGYKNQVSSGLPPWNGLTQDCERLGGEWDGGGSSFANPGLWDPVAAGVQAPTEFPCPAVTTHDVDALLDVMLANCGCTKPNPDSVLLRWRNEVAARTGHNKMNHVDYPTLATGSYPTASQADEIPDAWKTAHGLSTSIDYSTVIAPNGYSWPENYANDVAGDVVPGLIATLPFRSRRVQFAMGFGF